MSNETPSDTKADPPNHGIDNPIERLIIVTGDLVTHELQTAARYELAALRARAASAPNEAEIRGQWDCVGAKPAETWEDMRISCHMTYNGGHRDQLSLEAFHHGMDTVFNCLTGGGFKEMNKCRNYKEPTT